MWVFFFFFTSSFPADTISLFETTHTYLNSPCVSW